MHRINKYLPAAILIFVVSFHAILLLPELIGHSPDVNDDVFHYSLCVSMQNEIENRGNPIDHWVPYWSMGFPVFHHYQHLPHLIVVLTYNLLLKKISLFFVYHLIKYLLLILYPLILYYSLKKMGFTALFAACASLFSLSPSGINGYGFELGSFTWRGFGIFSQLWAMCLFPLTVSGIYVSIKENRNYFLSVALLFMLTISQVMFGLMAAVTVLPFLFMDLEPARIWERTKRLLLIFTCFLLMAAYFFVPMIIDSPYQAHSTYDFPEKWDSYGAHYAVTQFLNGNILDLGRLPVLTFLAVAGLFFSLSRRSFKFRWAAGGFLLWFLLYFGRPTWGFLIDFLPLNDALHLHRIVALVQFFSVILAGFGLAAAFLAIKKRFTLIPAVLFIVLAAAPIYWSSFQYLQTNALWVGENSRSYIKEKSRFEPMLGLIKRSPPGRVYPGRRASWGNNFKIGQTAVFYLLSPNQIPALSFLPFSWALTGDFSENFNEYSQSHYDLFNIKYVLSEKGGFSPSFGKLIKGSGRFRLYEVKTTGYFDLVDSPIAVYGDKNSIWNLMVMWMRSPLPGKKQFISIFFDRKAHPGYEDYLLMKDRWEFNRIAGSAIKAGSVAAPSKKLLNIFGAGDFLKAEKYRSVSPGLVLSEKAGKNDFSCRVDAHETCFLLFKMTYHPCWHAYVDGKESQKTILSPGMIGVKVTKGVHSVKFQYRAQRWKNYLIILAFITAAVLFVWERKRK